MKVKVVTSTHAGIHAGMIGNAVRTKIGGYEVKFTDIPSTMPGETKTCNQIVWMEAKELEFLEPDKDPRTILTQAIRKIRSLGELHDKLEKYQNKYPDKYAIVEHFFLT